jgi:hypothetical protein
MKTLMVILLAGVTYFAAAPTFAGRDQTQLMAVQAAIDAKKVENLAQANQARIIGLAGPVGPAGKVGPGAQGAKTTRNPAAHP